MPNMNNKSIQKNANIFYDFFKACRLKRKETLLYLFAIVGYSLTETAAYTSIPFILKYIIDGVIANDTILVRKSVIAVIIITIAVSIAYCVFSYILLNSTNRIVKQIYTRVFSHMVRLPISSFHSKQSSDIMSLFSNDLNDIDTFLRRYVISIVQSIFLGIGSVVSMFYLDWKFSIYLILLNITVFYTNKRFMVKIKIIIEKIQAEKISILQNISDILSCFHIIKLFSLNDFILKRFDKASSNMFHFKKQYTDRVALSEIINFTFGWLNFGGTMALGGILVATGITGFGTIIALLKLTSVVNKMIKNINFAFINIELSVVSVNRVLKYLHLDTESCRDEQVYQERKDTEYAIELHNVVFTYDQQTVVLNGVDLSVLNGQTVGIIGPSGSGKSTIVKLLLGFYSGYDGVIRIQGKNLYGYSLNELRSLISYVPQEPVLFSGTIEDNIRIGKSNATTEEIINVSKMANAHEFIELFPNGYKHLIDKNGNGLSCGQKQMISIARAILRGSPIFILDEFTSSIDKESGKKIQRAIEQLRNDRTIILITHKLSSVKNADVIYLLNKGVVEAQGKHHVLMNGNDLYKKYASFQLICN